MKKQIIKALSLLLAASILTSCLKDDRLVLDPEKGNNVIEFANPATIHTIGSIYPLYVFSYALGADVTLPITVSYSGPESGAPEDITVNVAVGTQAEVDTYNDDQEEEYSLIDPASFAVSATSVVIKRGESKATFNVTLKPGTFSLTESLVLPLKITSVSSGIISGNFNTILLNVGAKNTFDGVYSLRGTITRNTAAGPDAVLGGYRKDKTTTLITSGLNSNTFAAKWKDGSNVGGVDALALSVDPLTNKVNVTSTGTANFKNTPGYDNRYDPATKTFYLAYDWGTAPATRLVVDTLVYQGVR